MPDISNSDDIIDSRDVIKRITELEDEREELESETEEDYKKSAALEEWDRDNGEELKALRDLAEAAEGYAPDWKHGATLIRDSHFKDYAQQYAEDIGALGRDMSWPHSCIDWDAAADELRQDYTSVEFDGVTYWVR